MQESIRQTAATAKQKTTPITPDAAYNEMLSDPKVILVETRDPDNVPQNERTDNVIFVSMETFQAQAALDATERTLDERLTNPDQRIITTWRLGNRAAVSALKLQEMGFTNVCYMEGGMEAWRDSGLPVNDK